MNDLRTAAQQAIALICSARLCEINSMSSRQEMLRLMIEATDTLRAALAEDARDWSLLEATQESLREHMAEIQRLRATLAQALAAMDTCVSSSDGEDSWFDHEQVYAARNAARAVMAQPATIAEWWAAKQAASGEPVAFDHDIGADRFKVVKGAFWWHIRIGDGTANVGKFHSKLAAEDMALKMLTAFRDGAYMQYHSTLVATAQPAPAPATTRPDGSYRTNYKCRDCGHEQAVTEVVAGGSTYVGSGANWCDKCGDGLPERTATPAQAAPASQASGEPVAWTYTGIKADGSEHGPHLVWNPAYMDAMSASKGAKATPLYATAQPAPARVPLTDEQIDRITAEQWGRGLGAPYAAYRAYARAVEAAHGIAEPK